MTLNDASDLICENFKNWNTSKKKAIVIGGPTASGKTSLSINVANELKGEIISCDSMQIYKYMNIGTAKPTEFERLQAVHHMIDFAEPWEEYSAADFCEKARKIMNDISSRGLIPILSGGTGLYISSLIDNIEFTESNPEEEKFTEYYTNLAETSGMDTVYSILEKEDPTAAANIEKNNKKRVIRAVVLLKTTGMTQSERNILSKAKESDYDFQTYILNPDRDILYSRIEQRVDLMMAEGLEKEVKTVLEKCREAYEKGCSTSPLPGKTAYQAIGYKEFEEYFKGNITISEVTDLIKLGSRRYAKRQLTWFRRIKNATMLDIEY